MGQAIAIVVGAGLIAAAILLVFRWESSIVSDGVVYRLDRWTGAITHCDDQWVQVKPAPGAPVKVDCFTP